MAIKLNKKKNLIAKDLFSKKYKPKIVKPKKSFPGKLIIGILTIATIIKTETKNIFIVNILLFI